MQVGPNFLNYGTLVGGGVYNTELDFSENTFILTPFYVENYEFCSYFLF